MTRSDSLVFTDIAKDVAEEVTRKDKAYGSSFDKSTAYLTLLWPDGIPVRAYGNMLMLVRDFDKNMRIATDQDAFGESPFRDKIGYSLLGERRRRRTLQEKKRKK